MGYRPSRRHRENQRPGGASGPQLTYIVGLLLKHADQRPADATELLARADRIRNYEERISRVEASRLIEELKNGLTV